jgi:hypothetical protein
VDPTTNHVGLGQLTSAVADALVEIDNSGRPHRGFQPGVGAYGEPQLVKLIAAYLSRRFQREAMTKRTPDLLIPKQWAIEFKIARQYGDNGKEAENWSVNLFTPLCWKREYGWRLLQAREVEWPRAKGRDGHRL